MQLNELNKSMEGVLPTTDSRFRPDIRAMENGDIGIVFVLDWNTLSLPVQSWLYLCVVDLASTEKKRLEEKQRTACKYRSKSTEDWKIRLVTTRCSLTFFGCSFSDSRSVLTHRLLVVINHAFFIYNKCEGVLHLAQGLVQSFALISGSLLWCELLHHTTLLRTKCTTTSILSGYFLSKKKKKKEKKQLHFPASHFILPFFCVGVCLWICCELLHSAFIKSLVLFFLFL